MEKVLVTGATGYIALHCVQQLLDKGYAVNGSIRSPERKNEIIDALKVGQFKGNKGDTGPTGSGFPFTGSARITGSLDLTGSLDVDGNITASGDISASSAIIGKNFTGSSFTGSFFVDDGC